MVYSEREVKLIEEKYKAQLEKLQKSNELKDKDIKNLKKQNKQKDEAIHDLDKNNYILSDSIVYIFFFSLGFIVDLIIVVISFLLLFKQNVIRRCLSFILKIAGKFDFLAKKNINIDDVLDRYSAELEYVKTHKIIIFLTFVLTFIQRLLMFSIIFVIYRGLGFTDYNYFELLMMQISVQLVIEAFPLPGGVGLSEEMLHNVFVNLHGINFAVIGMLLVRIFSFYIPLVISGFVVLVRSLFKNW